MSFVLHEGLRSSQHIRCRLGTIHLLPLLMRLTSSRRGRNRMLNVSTYSFRFQNQKALRERVWASLEASRLNYTIYKDFRAESTCFLDSDLILRHRDTCILVLSGGWTN